MKIESNGISMFVEDDGEGVPLVLVHGYPLNHTIWDAVVPLLMDRMRVITPDLRGYGESDAPEGVYSMQTLANDLKGMLDSLGVSKAVLAGHSMGGYVCLAFARAFPERVLGLALVSSQAGADAPDRKQGRYAKADEVAQQGVKIVADEMAPKLTTSPNLVPALHELIMSATPQGVIGSLKGMAERPDAMSLLRQLDVPALVIAGEADGVIPAAKSKEAADGFIQSTYVSLPGGGHMLMMESPERVAELLINFMRQFE